MMMFTMSCTHFIQISVLWVDLTPDCMKVCIVSSFVLVVLNDIEAL